MAEVRGVHQLSEIVGEDEAVVGVEVAEAFYLPDLPLQMRPQRLYRRRGEVDGSAALFVFGSPSVTFPPRVRRFREKDGVKLVDLFATEGLPYGIGISYDVVSLHTGKGTDSLVEVTGSSDLDSSYRGRTHLLCIPEEFRRGSELEPL